MIIIDMQRENNTNRRLIKQYAAAEGITEQFKARDQLKAVREINRIHARVEELVLSEPLYC